MSSRLLVAESTKRRCSASDSALHFEYSSARPRSENVYLARLEARLPILESNGFAERQGEDVMLSYTEVANLDDEDRALIDSLAPPAPISLKLEDRGHLGSADFRIEIEYYLGAKQVAVVRTGPFIEFHGRVYQLPWAAFELTQEVEALNATDAAGKGDLNQALRSWGRARSQAERVGAELSHYLEEEEVVLADRVAPCVVQSESGHTSIVPEVDGVPQAEFQKEYLKHAAVLGRYSVSDARGHKLRVVLGSEVRRVLEAWTTFRRMSTRERDRVLADPRQLLPEEVSPDVVDLSRYGPRVRAIGEYPASVRTYVSSGQRWDDLGDQDCGSAEHTAERFGLELGYVDGGTEHCEFEGIEEVETLLSAVRKAVRVDAPVVEFRGKKLRADQDLIAAIEELIGFAGQHGSEDEEGAEPPKRPRGVGLLIYTNEEELEFSLSPEETEALDTDDFIPPAALLPHVELKPHQQQGVAWLVHGYGARRPGVLLADDMGLGKTLQALTFLSWLIENPLSSSLGSVSPPWDPILVVAPPTLLGVWVEEIARFFEPSIFMPYQILTTDEARRMRIAQGRESQVGKPVLDVARLRENRLVLTSYQTLSAYGLSLGQLDWSVIISDEAQALKDPSTRTSIVFKALKCGFRLALTGTPVETRLLDVWNLFDSLHPGLLGSAKEFSTRYEPKDAAGHLAPTVDTARELSVRIGVAGSGSIAKGSRLLRRTKEDELLDLPRKHIHRVDSELGEAQRNAYLSLTRGFRSLGGRGNPLEILNQLNRLCQHPLLLTGDILTTQPDDLLRQCPKLQSLLQTLDRVAARREKALIFAHFRDAQAILKRVLDHRYKIDAPVLNGDRAGGTNRVHEARMQMIKRFEATPGFHAMIVSPRVGGVGLTITAANHVVHYGRWWNPAREDQCTDRVYRIGQQRDVHVYRLVAKDPQGQFRTFDERLDDLLEQRRTTADSFLMPQADEAQLAGDLAAAIGSEREDGSLNPGVERSLRSLREIAALSPEAFEAFGAALFEAQGYETFLTPLVNDGGVDVLALRPGEALLVQCKHTASRHALDAAVVGELDDGELYYREKVLPRALAEGRRVRCLLLTNAPRSRALSSAARASDTELIAEKDLGRLLGRVGVSLSQVARWTGSRQSSLDALRRALEAAGPTG